MKSKILIRFLLSLGAVISLGMPSSVVHAQEEELPQENSWYLVTPSIVWCDATTNKTDLFKVEIHIVNLANVTGVSLEADKDYQLFDDGTHGDLAAGDNVWTLSDISMFCWIGPDGISTPSFQLHVTLNESRKLTNMYLVSFGAVSSYFKGNFPSVDLGNGLSATKYAFFILDSQHEVMDSYPVANVFCGTTNYMAFRKLYSVFPDMFDTAIVTPAMTLFHPLTFGENVPYEVPVKNEVQHIGMPLVDKTSEFGSAGRLKSVIYHSFGDVAIIDHEIAHTWGATIGLGLGLLQQRDFEHWDELTDIGGQLGAYYFSDDGQYIGHFKDNGDGTWRLVANSEVEKYSPLELYIMGFISPDQVPPIHILSNIDLADLEHIKASVQSTVTIDQIIAAEGGARIPSIAESQKDFTAAYIVTSDQPYNDAAYAFFSILSYRLMSRKPPMENSSFAPFYWATNGLGTLDTTLPVDLPEAALIPGDPTATPLPTHTPTPAPTPTYYGVKPTVEDTAEITGESEPGKGFLGNCGLIPAAVILLPAVYLTLRKRIFH